jgi:hypothetical protein
MEEVEKTIKIENEKIKVVFTNEANPDEPSLEVEFICTKNSEGEKITQVFLDKSMFTREQSFMSALYMNTVDSLAIVKELFDKGEMYEGVRTITLEQYKQYLIKVRGVDPKNL